MSTKKIEKSHLYASRITDLLGSNAALSINGDHPLLLQGPDIVAGYNGKLYTFYMLDSDDLVVQESLLVKLALTTLALQSRATHCLIVDNNVLLSQTTQLAFGDKIFSRAEGITKSALNDVNERKANELDAIKKRNQIKYSASYAAALEHFSMLRDLSITAQTKRKKEPAFELSIHSVRQVLKSDDWTLHEPQKRLHVNKWAVHTDIKRVPNIQESVSSIAYKAHSIGYSRMSTLIFQLARASFYLDNGIPYPSNSFHKPAIILTQKIDIPFYDDYKIVRAAAFAGWTIFPFMGRQLINTQISKLSKKLQF